MDNNIPGSLYMASAYEAVNDLVEYLGSEGITLSASQKNTLYVNADKYNMWGGALLALHRMHADGRIFYKAGTYGNAKGCVVVSPGGSYTITIPTTATGQVMGMSQTIDSRTQSNSGFGDYSYWTDYGYIYQNIVSEKSTYTRTGDKMFYTTKMLDSAPRGVYLASDGTRPENDATWSIYGYLAVVI